MGDKDTLICKVGKMCHLNSKATMKEERSSSQNCHSIRPFTPLIFMCWENKISTERFTSFFSWVLQGWPEVYKRLYVSSYIGFEPIGIVGGGTRIWACQFKLAHTARTVSQLLPSFRSFRWWLDKEIWRQSGVVDGGEQRPLSRHKGFPRHNEKHYSAFITYPHLEFINFNLEIYIGTIWRSNPEGI